MKHIAIVFLIALSALSARGFDITLGPNGQYQEALAAFEAVNRAAAEGHTSVTLTVEPGVYWLDDPDDPAERREPDNSVPFAVRIACDTLQIVGTDPDPEATVFAVNRGQTRGAYGNYTMLNFKGKSLAVSNLTFGNYCNVDLVYPRDPSKNRARRCTPIVQAQIGICDDTDRLLACNCRFISRLNLCPLVGARRSLYENCYFECTDDALSGTAVYLGCKFTFFSSKPFYSTSKTGAVFLDCDIDLRGSSPQYLTKMPGMVTMIDCRFTGAEDTVIRWTRDYSPFMSYYSCVTLNGRPYAIDADRPEMSTDISGTRLLDAYKVTLGDTVIYNTPNLMAGDDGWDPLGVTPLIASAERRLRKPLRWLAVMADLGTPQVNLNAQDDWFITDTYYYRWGGYRETIEKPRSVTWTHPTVVTVKDGPVMGRVVIGGNNPYPNSVPAKVIGRYDNGLTAVITANVGPLLIEAPTFSVKPGIVSKNGSLTANYALQSDSPNIEDMSDIIWYTGKDRNGSDTIPVLKDRRTYTPSPGDVGRYITVKVTPRLYNSKPGVPMVYTMPKPIGRNLGNIRGESHYHTDFYDIPVATQPRIARGVWTFDCHKPNDTMDYPWTPDSLLSWHYGPGTDGAAGKHGLQQTVKGARAIYTPGRESCREMSATIQLAPCKSAGQGFGSATGQYFDIYLAYDPATHSGYGLRIQRTVDYDHAVVFSLIHTVDGEVTVLADPQPSTCYKDICTVNLTLGDGRLSATASSTAPGVSDIPGVTKTVALSAPVEGKKFLPSFGLQHTGSTGTSATLVTDLELNWK